MNSGIWDEEDYPARKRTRRTKLLDKMPDEKLEKRNRKPKFKSKPKGFKHNRRKNQKRI